jgi:hypothetical protein
LFLPDLTPFDIMTFPNVPNPYPPGWNDPPKDIFVSKTSKGSQDVLTADGSWTSVVTLLQSLMAECEQAVSGQVRPLL